GSARSSYPPDTPAPPPGAQSRVGVLREVAFLSLGEEGSLATACVLSRILVDLLKLNVAPLAVFQMLKSMCAGQRLASEPQDPVAVSLPTSSVPETRGRNKGSTALGGGPALAERGGREGSSQRMPRQPSATRLPK
uniref:Mitotic-spindle organizing protein 2B n=1 Tax=Panthera tigris altaica TaxID=74533 RepID=A0A8C9JLC0_PANTA